MLLALKLSSVFNEIAHRHFDLVSNTTLDVIDRTGQVAAFGITANDNPTPCVLAIDRIWPGADTHIRNLAKFNLSPIGLPFAIR